MNPDGITLHGGIGYFAVRDAHISENKYAGFSSWFELRWSWFHETYGFRLGLTYQSAGNVKNHNVSADVRQGSLQLATLYPLGPLRGQNTSFSAGPAVDFLIHFRTQNIAHNNSADPNIYTSGLWLGSFGARLEATYPLCTGVTLDGALQISVLSLGGGTGQAGAETIDIKLLTPFAALHGVGTLGLAFQPFAWVLVRAGYTLDVVRIESWNSLIASNDVVVLTLGVLL